MAAGSDIRRTIGQIDKAGERVVKRLATSVNAELIKATPVDTGWARANWIFSIGQPIAGPAGAPGKVGPARQAQSSGVARVLVYKLNQGVIWLSNNVPYIQVLNAGHSKQAPAGFIEAAIDRGVRKIQG